MTHYRCALFLTLAVLSATRETASAQARPMLIPQHDAVIVYHLEGGGPNAPHDITASFQAGGGKLRIAFGGQPGFMLIDRTNGKAEMVIPGANLAVETGLGRQIDHALDDPSAHFEKGGSDRVAGVRCERWTMRAARAEGAGCVSADGLILEAKGHDRKGGHIALQATRVTEAPLPDGTFAAPSATLRLDDLKRLTKALRAP